MNWYSVLWFVQVALHSSTESDKQGEPEIQLIFSGRPVWLAIARDVPRKTENSEYFRLSSISREKKQAKDQHFFDLYTILAKLQPRLANF